MTVAARNHAQRVGVVPAGREQEPLFAHLLDLYAHELSAFHPVEFGPNGRFVYRDLPSYWQEPGKIPLLITIGENAAGFALVRQIRLTDRTEPLWDVAEFFVLKEHRRAGVATEAAHRAWRLFSGRWQVRVLQANRVALRFWEKVLGDFVGATPHSSVFKKGDELWRLFSFESPRAEHNE